MSAKAKAKALAKGKAKAGSDKKSTDALLERRRLKAQRDAVPEFDKILRDPNNYVNMSPEQIFALDRKINQSNKTPLKDMPLQDMQGAQQAAARKMGYKGLPKDVRALLSEDTLKQAGISVEVLRLLAPYCSGNVLDKEELFFLVRIWRSLEAAYWAGHIGGRIGLEIGSSWDCLRSKICVDALKASHMYVIVPDGRRAEECRREVHAPEYCDRITVVSGNTSVVKLPNNAKVDFLVFEPPQNVQLGGPWKPEDTLILETAKQRFLTDPRLPGAATII